VSGARPLAGAAGARLRALAPRGADYAGLRHRGWTGDLVAGVTVAVVALPLALAFGAASGVGATAGLVTAVVAGTLAAVFGGSAVQVSGPTGAMTVVLVPLVATHGVSVVPAVALLAGVFVVLAGVFGLGRLVTFIPWPVVEGFTFGIAVVIAAQQVPSALGVDKPDGENAALVALRATGRFLERPDLVTAVELGVAGAVLVAVVKLGDIARAVPEEPDFGVDDDEERALLRRHVLVYRLEGPLFFLVAARFLRQLTAGSDVRVVVLRLGDLAMLDATGARALGTIVEELRDRDIAVLLKVADPAHVGLLRTVGALDLVEHEGHVFAELEPALQLARTLAGEQGPVGREAAPAAA
jgi:MFS superfamily sulfate permease-like transporter